MHDEHFLSMTLFPAGDIVAVLPESERKELAIRVPARQAPGVFQRLFTFHEMPRREVNNPLFDQPTE